MMYIRCVMIYDEWCWWRDVEMLLRCRPLANDGVVLRCSQLWCCYYIHDCVAYIAFWDGAYARWDGLYWRILRWRLCLVDASINWQIFEMGVLLQWYHMHLHSIESHYMIAYRSVYWCGGCVLLSWLLLIMRWEVVMLLI